MTTLIKVNPTHRCEVTTFDMTQKDSDGEAGQITSSVILEAGTPEQSFTCDERAAITVNEIEEGVEETDGMREAQAYQERQVQKRVQERDGLTGGEESDDEESEESEDADEDARI